MTLCSPLGLCLRLRERERERDSRGNGPVVTKFAGGQHVTIQNPKATTGTPTFCGACQKKTSLKTAGASVRIIRISELLVVLKSLRNTMCHPMNLKVSPLKSMDRILSVQALLRRSIHCL